jgi:hypothetical protein
MKTVLFVFVLVLACAGIVYGYGCEGTHNSCESYDEIGQVDCENHACSWTDACSGTPNDCTFYDEQSYCEAQGCVWDSGCTGSPYACNYWGDQINCEGINCSWTENPCSGTPHECSTFGDEGSCNSHGESCGWNNNCDPNNLVAGCWVTSSLTLNNSVAYDLAGGDKGIIVSGENTVLDCDNSIINCDLSGGFICIAVLSGKNVTVKNCIINRSNIGVASEVGDSVTFFNNQITSDVLGVYGTGTNNTFVEQNIINSGENCNSNDCIGVKFDNSHYAVIYNNQFNTLKKGVSFPWYSGDNFDVKGNTFNDVVMGLMIGYGAYYVNFSDNFLDGIDDGTGVKNEQVGIRVDADPDSGSGYYFGNNYISRFIQGMLITKARGVIIEGNTVVNFSYTGIYAGDSNAHDFEIKSNIVTDPISYITQPNQPILGMNLDRFRDTLLVEGNIIDMKELGYPAHNNDGGRPIFGLQIFSDNIGDVDSVTVRGNTISNLGNHSSDSISAYPANWAQAVNIAGVGDLIFEDNIITKSVGTLGFGFINNALIQNNRFERVLQIALTRSGSNYLFDNNVVQDGSYAGGFGISCQNSATCNITNNNISGFSLSLGSNTGLSTYASNNIITSPNNPYKTGVSYDGTFNGIMFQGAGGTNIIENNEYYGDYPSTSTGLVQIASGVNTISGNIIKANNCSIPTTRSGGTLLMYDTCTNYNMTAVPELNYVQSGDAFDKGLFSEVQLQWDEVPVTYGTRYYSVSIYNGTAWNLYDGLSDLSKVWEIANLPVGTYAVRLQAYTDTEWSMVQETTLSVEQVYTTQGVNTTQDTQINYTDVAETPSIENTGAGITVDLSGAEGTGVIATSEYTSVPVSVATPEISVKIIDVYVSSGITGTINVSQTYDEPTLPSAVSEDQLRLYAWYDGQWNLGSNQNLDTALNTVSAEFPADKLTGSPIILGYLEQATFVTADLPNIFVDIFGTAGTEFKVYIPLIGIFLVGLLGVGAVLAIRTRLK